MPPFPTSSSSSRPRPNVNLNSNGYYEDGGYDDSAPFPTTPTTHFQQRPISHAESVSSNGSNLRNNPGGPNRPPRSELRTRQVSQRNRDQYPNDEDARNNYSREKELFSSRSMTSGLRQQDNNGARSDREWDRSESPVPIARPRYVSERGDLNGGVPRSSVEQPRTNGRSNTMESEVKPEALNTIMAAFQTAGGKRRGNTLDAELDPWEIERQKERERERERAQRIQARQAERRAVNGRRTRPGDVDG